jgi:ABC-2 type transport system permease protein
MSAETVSVPRYGLAGWLPGLAPAGVVARGMIRGALLWGAVFGLLVWLLVSQFAQEYPTDAARAMLVATMGTDAGMQAIFGMAHHLGTVGGYVAYHVIGMLGIIGGVWGLLAATRLLRGEEDAGRWELLLAGPVTRRRAALAGLAGLGAGLAALWAVTAAITVAAGSMPEARFPATASLFLALTAVAPAAMFATVGALCGQLAATRRQAAGVAAAIFGAAYLVRLVANSNMSLMWLRWASPLGWVDESRPLTGSRPLALIPIGALIAALAGATVILAGQRDLGASVLPASDSAPARTRLLTGPLGLAIRLGQRGALGWIAGVAGGGFIIGMTAKTSADLWSNSSSQVMARLGGAAGGAAYLGIAFLIITLVVTLAGAALAGATRDEEASGYLDHLLARPVARLPWLAGRIAVSAAVLALAGLAASAFAWAGAEVTGAGLSFATLLAAGVNVIPAGVFVLGIGTLVHGLAPRFTSVAAYAVVAWSFLAQIIGAAVGAGQWLLDTSVLQHVARAPAAPVRWDTAAIIAGIGIAAALAGTLAFRHRDLAGA